MGGLGRIVDGEFTAFRFWFKGRLGWKASEMDSSVLETSAKM